MASTLFLAMCCVFTISASAFAASVPNKFSIAHTHIIGGTNVPERLPYQISLRVLKQVDGTQYFKHFCGGSLVKPDIVLTAAHCLNEEYIRYLRMGMLYAVAGTNFLHFKIEKTFVSLVISASKYPKYLHDKDDNNNDVALLKLENPAVIDNKNIGLIPLRQSAVKAGEKCKISGWGTVESGRSEPSEYLQWAKVPIVDRTECHNKYEILNATVSVDMICAGLERGGVDSCQGDSGGPLVCNNELTGVVSWGFKCGIPYFPGVYASVPYHKRWIDETITDFRHGIKISINDTQESTIPESRPPNGVTSPTVSLITLFVSLVLTIL